MLRRTFMGAMALALLTAPMAQAQDGTVRIAMSWANYQEERWRIDEAGLQEGAEELGAELMTADAQSSSERQASDIDSLLARGIDVLMIVAQDNEAILPAVERALAEGVTVIAYERQIEHPDVFYVGFDPVEVGRVQARELIRVQPEGNYVLINGSPTDAYAHFVLAGNMEVLEPHIADNSITIVAEQWTEGWVPEIAQGNMENILTAVNDDVDAVVAANDGTAGGVLAALTAEGLAGIPVSGQDGDHAALNRIARGLQTMTAWKDATELGRIGTEVAVALAQGTEPEQVDNHMIWDQGPREVAQNAVMLAPVTITHENLDVVVDAGWIGAADLCAGLTDNAPAPCQ